MRHEHIVTAAAVLHMLMQIDDGLARSRCGGHAGPEYGATERERGFPDELATGQRLSGRNCWRDLRRRLRPQTPTAISRQARFVHAIW